ncbi:hypothetical protein D3C80_1707490 [compost metagenome]
MLGDGAEVAVAAALAGHLVTGDLQSEGIAARPLQLPVRCLQLCHIGTRCHGAASQGQCGQQGQFLVHAFISRWKKA